MGYTHYWESLTPLEISSKQKSLIKQVLKKYKDILFGGNGTGKPIFNEKELIFNGNKENDMCHETFVIEFQKVKDFAFCKTARKPYDLPVCKILLILSLSDGFYFSSDGTDQINGQKVLNDENWKDALNWFIEKGYEKTITEKIIPRLNKY